MCKDCGGGYICVHQKQRRTCPTCFPLFSATDSRQRNSRRRQKSRSSSRGVAITNTTTQAAVLDADLTHIRLTAAQLEEDLSNAHRRFEVCKHSFGSSSGTLFLKRPRARYTQGLATFVTAGTPVMTAMRRRLSLTAPAHHHHKQAHVQEYDGKLQHLSQLVSATFSERTPCTNSSSRRSAAGGKPSTQPHGQTADELTQGMSKMQGNAANLEKIIMDLHQSCQVCMCVSVHVRCATEYLLFAGRM